MPPPRPIPLCCLLALLALWTPVQSAGPPPEPTHVRVVDLDPQSEELDTDGTDDLGFSADAQRRRPALALKRLWGVPDATAPVGRLFLHRIEPDAFQGHVERYQVSGQKADDPLPAWLTYDPRTLTFAGVPLQTDLGPHLIAVRAHGVDGKSTAKDVFMADVVMEPDSLLGDDVPDLSCADHSASVVMSVYFDVAPSALGGAERLKLLRAVAAAAGLNAEALQMTSHSGELPLDEAGLLEAGSGVQTREGKQLAAVFWKVGCEESVIRERQGSVDAIRGDAGLRRLSELSGRPAVAWLLHSVPRTSTRRRRQVEGSGDYYDGEYDDYYDDDDYDPDLYPDERVIPGLATPAFGAPPASPVYPPPRVSAAYPHFGAPRMNTPIPVPVIPTRYSPEPALEPSRVVEPPASPTVTDTTHLEPSMSTADGIVEATARLPPAISVTPSLAPPVIHETVEVGVRNLPPYLSRRMRKLALIAGREYRLQVPAGTFMDLEDGDTRDLALALRKENGALLSDTDWLQFNSSKQEIYALPMEEDIGEYKFILTATDGEGLSATDTLHVQVRQYPQWRAINHRVSMDIVREKRPDSTVQIDWQLRLLQQLARTFGQDSTASVLVYELLELPESPLRLKWVNATLSTHWCDAAALAEMNQRLRGKSGEPSAQLRKMLSPEFSVKRVQIELVNVCRDVVLDPEREATVAPPETNRAPVRHRPLDLIPATVGTLLKLQVPEGTFFDAEDGGTREMQLRLLTNDRQPVPVDSWLFFEPKNQEFIGLPLDKDVGRSHYHLECIDSGGLKVSDSLEVHVKPRDSTREYNVEFSVTLENDFRRFSRDALQKTRLIQKIAALFGDATTDQVVVHDIQPGSIVFSWFNASLPRETCPNQQIGALRQRLLDDDGRVTRLARSALDPDFDLVAAEVTPRGVCLGAETPTEPAAPSAPPAGLDEKAPQGRGDEYLVTYIIPAVVIAAMLLIAGIIACVLFRARRRGKMTMTENGTYVSRGIPVIFADELEERLEKNAKAPVILKNERPPQPPTYPTEPASASPATPMLEAAGEDTPYERPPPFAGVHDSGRQSRAKPMPNYRQPPPYVPP